MILNQKSDGIISPKADPQMTVGELNPQVPAIISEIVTKATALMPNDCFQSAEEMKFALLKAKQTLDASTTRQVKKDVAAQTNIDAFNDWEKAKPLFDEDEESLGQEFLFDFAEFTSELSRVIFARVCQILRTRQRENRNFRVGWRTGASGKLGSSRRH